MSNHQFVRMAQRFIVNYLESGLRSYSNLGHQTTYNDENFLMIKRNKVDLHTDYFHDNRPSRSV